MVRLQLIQYIYLQYLLNDYFEVCSEVRGALLRKYTPTEASIGCITLLLVLVLVVVVWIYHSKRLKWILTYYTFFFFFTSAYK